MTRFDSSRGQRNPSADPGKKEPRLATVLISLVAWFFWSSSSSAVDSPSPAAAASSPSGPAATPAPRRLFIREYRVEGAHLLPRIEVEEAVYPFLGPGRGSEDVEAARAALEKAYQQKGFQTVSVQIPQQQVRGGVVFLQVVEAPIGRLTVKGARYFSPNLIKEEARSLAEGKVANFNDVSRDIVALNQLPDRQVTPVLRPGVEPGTVDIDLNVKDTLPLHGSIELNNRYSADTTPLRVNGAVSYNNLWQLGHSAGFSFQLAPQSPDEVKVFSAYYVARFPEIDWLSLMVQATKQDSNVSTLGSVDVAGRGETLGLRAIITLPPGPGFYHSLTFGVDYKHVTQTENLGGEDGGASVGIPLVYVTYYPISATYSATAVAKGYSTDFSAGVTFGIRGLGTNTDGFNASRFNASPNFIYIQSSLSHTHDLPGAFQIFGKIQGQLADQPLVDSEQISGGGLETVRGYLESEVLGDNGIFGSVELRTPSLLGWLPAKSDEWRFYVFGDAGALTIRDPLPEQASRFNLASIGVGSRIKLLDHLNGSVDIGLPLISETETRAGHPLLTFRVWGDF